MLSDPEMAEPAAEDRVDTRDAAREAGLRYVSDEEPGYRRKRNGRGFAYVDGTGAKVRDAAALARIRSLAIPPAYTDVWICRHANGHIQATGRDARGRKQYRYHPEFRQARESTKFAHMMTFAEVLPGIRATVEEHMGRRGLPREKVLATVVHLLETTLIRVGNDDYAKQNKSYGLTTLRDPHVRIEGRELRFRFKGKSNKVWELAVHDRRVAKIVKACQDLPGQELFQYLDEDGEQRDVTSADVNAYLREITGRDITAKDFRTWSGTVLAAMALREFEAFDSEAKAKRNVRAAIERVAERLGNTPTICRKCYIHPEILGCYLEGELLLQVKDEVEAALRDDIARLRPEETAVLGLLQGRLARAAQEARTKAGTGRNKGSSSKGSSNKGSSSKRSTSKDRMKEAEPGKGTMAKGRSVKGERASAGSSRSGKAAARKAA
ncbi:DNA topoisomerase IB [Methylobacterium currus]|uniref:DNA topoisomerase n=1 Tax=Methylobacterium currus TaxID=2051553 RepID=A0A2R4WQN5_9HYPH|nr:DNA topoisomerase IB [Methylobacterium currus]AWB23839.1 DNA topoisomerase IB [Methylobacterium currus]UHC16504.1 DNA topoisomerase IB [Methylobacterium currus]